MSRFYLVEFRYKRQRRWHPWIRLSSRSEARAMAKELLSPSGLRGETDRAANADRARVVAIDTDAGTLTTIWEVAS